MADVDHGPLRPRRNTAVGGLAPSSQDPITAEYAILKGLNPTELKQKVANYLNGMGVTKQSTLPDGAPHIMIGRPRHITRNGVDIVVWEVLNAEIPGWTAINPGVPGDNGMFSENRSGDGLYTNGGKNVYVHSLTDGQAFLDDITASVLNTGIIYNAHSPGYASSVYHEIFHTFEGEEMKNSFFLKEGIVEWFSDQFRKAYFGVSEPYYPPYDHAAKNAAKLAAFAGVSNLAKAYFADDKAAINGVIPLMYGPIANTLKVDERLAADCIDDATMKWGELKRMLMPTTVKIKQKDPTTKWYTDYVAAKGVPTGGPALPPAGGTGGPGGLRLGGGLPPKGPGGPGGPGGNGGQPATQPGGTPLTTPLPFPAHIL